MAKEANEVDPEMGSFEEMRARLCTNDWDDIFDLWQDAMKDLPEEEVTDFGIWVVINYHPGPERSNESKAQFKN